MLKTCVIFCFQSVLLTSLYWNIDQGKVSIKITFWLYTYLLQSISHHLSSSSHIQASHKEPGEEPDGQGQADHSNSESSDHDHQVILGEVGEVEHAGGISRSDVAAGKIQCSHGKFIFDVIKSFSLNKCLNMIIVNI